MKQGVEPAYKVYFAPAFGLVSELSFHPAAAEWDQSAGLHYAFLEREELGGRIYGRKAEPCNLYGRGHVHFSKPDCEPDVLRTFAGFKGDRGNVQW